MTVVDLVSNLRHLDIRLSAEGDRLRVNAPKGVLTESLRAQIAECKHELLQFLSDYEQSAAFVPPPIVSRRSTEPAPLSFAQERLWFLEQLEPGSAVYNICRAWRVLGEVNLSAIESSLNEIVRQHEVLCSSIRVDGGRPVQVVEPPFELNLSVIDLQCRLAVGPELETRRRIQQAVEAPLDFAAGKFLRADVLRVADDEHVLILATHHIVSDAWSMGILTRELWSLYEAYAAGKSSRLKEPQIQYADFAMWQREWLQGDVLEAQVSYWKEQLKDLSHLNMPTDRPRPARQSFEAARIPISLPETLTAAIHELSNQAGVTPFMILLAAFEVLLYRYCGQEEIVVGSPIANRARTELEPLIGFFVNTLVLRSNLSGNPAFKEHLARVREVCLGAYAHQDLPFEKLVQELQPERDQSRNPLFQVMFGLQNATRPFSGISGLRIEPLEVESTRSSLDLSVFLRERDGKYTGSIEYSTDLFNRDRIERMATHYRSLLEAVVANPDQPIATVPILTEAERGKILVEWNDTAADYPKDKCIHELFEAQVEQTPEAIAVQFEGKQLTYRELNRRANQLAHYLHGLGVGPEKLVGICVERSLEMLIGLLGILKAGGAYVPLDHSYPRERLEFMLKDSQCSFLLTQQSIVEDGRWRMEDGGPREIIEDGRWRIEDGHPLSSILYPRFQVVCLDRDAPLIAERQDDPSSGVGAGNLAYVIYTSGSTGQPKGVAIEHRNTVALLYWAKSVFTNDELSGVLASTSICFDLSVFELFVPLSWGGKIVLAENALQLHSMPDTNDVTLINTVPSVMTELLAMGNLSDSVRTINLAGEPLRSELVKQIHESANAEKVYDLYGPSESTTYSTFMLRTAEAPPTIGRPISNTRIYILDGNLQPVPIGVSGELHIGGPGVARGYLNWPELTWEKFILDPFSNEMNARLYRTGDLARYRSDGNIEFLGRADNQVKIRGYRVELGEIEAVLNQHPAVKNCVVVAREDVTKEESGADNPKSKIENPKSNSRLVAYLVPTGHQRSVNELRGFLKEKLPEFMVPSVFVMLEALPLTPNGKVDRQKLPRPDDTRPRLTEEFVEPRSEIEEFIAQTWREVLKVKNVGIHDSFFELGGHSLLAIQIVSRLREAFNREIPLRVLFETPTIVGLASCIEGFIREGRCPDLPPIVSVPRHSPLPLSLNQEHLWNLDQMIPGTHLFNMPYLYRLSGDLRIDALEKTLREIIKRHEALRTVFTEVDGRPVQIIKAVPEFQLPVADLRCSALGELENRAARLIVDEREAPFDLGTGPLLRLKVIRLKEEEWFLLVTMHHIIGDQWSMEVFRNELAILYDAFSRAHPSPFPDPILQFADFACWERSLLQSGHLNGQLDYWKQQLTEPVPVLKFCRDGQGEKQPSFRTLRRCIELDQNLFTNIKKLARKENSTTFVVLLAALDISLYLCTGQHKIRIGTLIANRGRRECDAVIGHFMNTLVLSAHVDPDMSFRHHLREAQRMFLSAYARQELPFEQLARVLTKEHGVARGSLFQVLVSYQRVTSRSKSLSGLTFAAWNMQFEDVDVELTPTTYDLIFSLRDLSTTLTGSVNYKTHFFDRDDPKPLLESFRKVLHKMITGLEDRIGSIS